MTLNIIFSVALGYLLFLVIISSFLERLYFFIVTQSHNRIVQVNTIYLKAREDPQKT